MTSESASATLAILAAALLAAADGNTQALVPLFAVGVFVGFTLSQLGMVRHWRAERSGAWAARAVINAIGAFLTPATTIVEPVSTTQPPPDSRRCVRDHLDDYLSQRRVLGGWQDAAMRNIAVRTSTGGARVL